MRRDNAANEGGAVSGLEHWGKSAATPPVAETRPTRRVIHGRVLDDPYGWLAAENWREVLSDPATLPADIADLVKAENAYCEQRARPARRSAKRLQAELRGRIKEDDSEPPWPDGALRLFRALSRGRRACALLPHDARRRRGDKSSSTATRKPAKRISSTSARSTIRPIMRSSPGASTTRARNIIRSAPAPSPTARIAPDVVPHTRRLDRLERGFEELLLRARRRQSSHRASVPPRCRRRSRDRRAHRRGARSRLVRLAAIAAAADASPSSPFAAMTPANAISIDLRDKDATPRLVAPREPKLRYDVEPHGDDLYIRSNADGAEDFAIFRAPLSQRLARRLARRRAACRGTAHRHRHGLCAPSRLGASARTACRAL